MLPAQVNVTREKSAPVRMPLVLRKPILKLVKESELRLDDLSSLIYNHLKVFFLPGEVVQFIRAKQGGNIIKGNVIKRIVNKKKTSLDATTSTLTDVASSFTYDIKLFEKNEVITSIPSTALRRHPHSPSVNVLQAFIQANAKYEENSSSHFHWVLSRKKSVKTKKNIVTLKKALSEQKKNVKPAFIMNEKLKLEGDLENPGMSQENKTAGLKRDTLQPPLKKRKLGKLAKSPKSGVPPIWAKLIKSFPLEPEVVLVRLEDRNGSTSNNLASPQKSKLKEKSPSVVCGKENKASSSLSKKMKQMTLFDMSKKLVPPSASKSVNCSVKIEIMKDCIIPGIINNTNLVKEEVDNAKGGLINAASNKRKRDQHENCQKIKKADESGKKHQKAIKDLCMLKMVASTESNQLQKNSTLKNDSSKTSNKSPREGSTITKISFSDFTSKIKSSPENYVSTKSPSQGILDGILKKSVTQDEKIPKPLLQAKPVKTPPGFENEWFGDAVMIMQFISAFRNVLQPDKSISLSTAMLMEAIMKDSNGFYYLNNILVCLLRTLFQGCSAKEYVEAGVSLSEVPITIYSASELTRLCLCDKPNDEDSFLLDKKLNSLSSKELHQLEPYDKLKIICQLCTNVLTCYTIENYVSEIRKTVKILRNENLQAIMEKKKIKRMLLEKETNNDEIETNEENLSPEQKLNPGSFYGMLALNDSIEKGLSGDELQSCFTKRTISLQKSKEEKLEAEKIKREQALKEKDELKKQKVEEDFRKNLRFHINETKSLRGLRPLGNDRNMTRYWLFSHFTPQLVLEKGSWEGMNSDNETDDDSIPNLSPKKAKLDSVSCKQVNRWFAFETAAEVKSLLKCLSMEDNVKSLKYSLKKYLSDISVTSTKTNPKEENQEQTNGDLDLMEAFREEILDVHSKIMEGVLGDLCKSKKWFSDVDNANTCQDFAQCLLALQNSLYPKFFCGAFGNCNPNNRKVEINKKERPGKTNNLETWQNMVKSCQTMSRLHLLLGLFSACIQWDKSSANTKCKVCRKNVEDTLLLCDNCTNGFHLGCLRPRLRNAPRNDWFCPSCKKSMEESESGESSEEDNEEEGSSEEEEDVIDAMKKKVVCGKCKLKGDERLLCVKCYKGWHPVCHNPPMRNIPRGPWFCQKCRSKNARRTQRSK